MVTVRTFRIFIPETSLVKYPKPVWDRFMRFVKDNSDSDLIEGTAYKDSMNNGWVLVGAGTNRMITILLAAARGEDLTMLLDKFEEKQEE